jgi:hypothetical protein
VKINTDFAPTTKNINLQEDAVQLYIFNLNEVHQSPRGVDDLPTLDEGPLVALHIVGGAQ